MRVGYARVSTADQSPELQLEALRHAGCEKVFTEKASGAKADRPELAHVLRDVLRQDDVLVVWKLDRLARSLKKLITTAEELEERGIGLVSLTESIDTTTPGGMLVFHVFGAIAQFERALNSRTNRCRPCGGTPPGPQRWASTGIQSWRRHRSACPDEGGQAAGARRREAHGCVGCHAVSPCRQAWCRR